MRGLSTARLRARRARWRRRSELQLQQQRRQRAQRRRKLEQTQRKHLQPWSSDARRGLLPPAPPLRRWAARVLVRPPELPLRPRRAVAAAGTPGPRLGVGKVQGSVTDLVEAAGEGFGVETRKSWSSILHEKVSIGVQRPPVSKGLWTRNSGPCSRPALSQKLFACG